MNENPTFPKHYYDPDKPSRDAQAELDRKDIGLGHTFDCSDFLIGNGSIERPLLNPVGVDRYGRIWACERVPDGEWSWKGRYRLLTSWSAEQEARDAACS